MIITTNYNMTHRRRSWELEEDDAINALVLEFGTRKWALLARSLETRYEIKGRSGKQCRERWTNQLDPFVNKKPWSGAEEGVLFRAQQKYGNLWSVIAKHLPGRTENCVKNHFYSTLRRNLRKLNKNRPVGEKFEGPVKDLLSNPELALLLLSYKDSEISRKKSNVREVGKTRVSERLQSRACNYAETTTTTSEDLTAELLSLDNLIEFSSEKKDGLSVLLPKEFLVLMDSFQPVNDSPVLSYSAEFEYASFWCAEELGDENRGFVYNNI